MAGYVHICRPEVVTKRAIAATCPDCKQRTRLLAYSYEWYGPDYTCIKCGRSFNEEAWCALPFVRGARAKEIKRAKERFRATVAIGVDALIAKAKGQP